MLYNIKKNLYSIYKKRLRPDGQSRFYKEHKMDFFVAFNIS